MPCRTFLKAAGGEEGRIEARFDKAGKARQSAAAARFRIGSVSERRLFAQARAGRIV